MINNPLVPGDPFSYDLDWVVSELKTAISLYQPLHDEFEAISDEFTDLKTYIQDYFDNLDLSQEVSDKIDGMISSGYFDLLIGQIVNSSGKIEDATTDWLTAHITQPTTPAIDDTLTIQGAAADAKATGDRMERLMNVPPYRINGYSGGNIAQFYYEKILGKYAYVGSQNQLVLSTSSSYNVWHYIDVPAGTYTIGQTQWWVITDASGNVLDGTNTTVTSITVPDHADVYLSWPPGATDPDFYMNDPTRDWTITDLTAETHIDTTTAIPDFNWPVTEEIKLQFDTMYFYRRAYKGFLNNDYYYSRKDESGITLWRPSVGSVTNTLRLYSDLDMSRLTEKRWNINYTAMAASDITALFIGDSTIADGTMIRQFVTKYQQNGGTVTLLGTKNAPYNCEGISGATAKGLANNPTVGGVTNPFYNGTEFDFPYYMTQNGYTDLDVVVIQLGINDLAGGEFPEDYDTRYPQLLTALQKMVDSIHTYDPNIKVIYDLMFGPSSLWTGWDSRIWANPDAPRYLFIKANAALINDLTNAIIAPTNLIPDPKTEIIGVHPTTAGYQKLGTFMANFIAVQ